MEPSNLDRLKATLLALKGHYKATKTETESRVVRWQWATDRYYSPIPYEQERFRLLRGTLLDKEPKTPKSCCAFGFDQQDRLCLVRAIGADGKPQSEQFVAYDGDLAVIRGYLNGGKSIGKVVELALSGGAPRESHTLGAEGDRISERYQHSDGRLVSIDVEQFRAATKKAFTHRYELHFPAPGKVEATRVEAHGKRVAGFSLDIPE